MIVMHMLGGSGACSPSRYLLQFYSKIFLGVKLKMVVIHKSKNDFIFCCIDSSLH